ncbi:MAG TPA: hypothetical protein VFT84_09405, partial [Gemmatimonadales bacterium]|nr:hypothetical protein [Gemmatimonadales bacterium]
PPDTGREVALDATMSDRIIRLAVTAGDTTRSETAALSPARGWTLFAPFGLGLGPRVPLLTSLVLLGLTLPLGYWAARAPWLPGGLMLGTALVAGLGGIPAVTGFPPVALSEWAGAVGGAAAGWALSRAAAYLQPRCGSPSTAEFSSS